MKVYSSHKISKSDYGSAYNCALCYQSFINPANLVKHVEFVHEPELSPEKSSVGLIPKEKDPVNKENVDPGNNKEVCNRAVIAIVTILKFSMTSEVDLWGQGSTVSKVFLLKNKSDCFYLFIFLFVDISLD